MQDISDPKIALSEEQLMRERAYAETEANTFRGRLSGEIAEFLKQQVHEGKITPKESIQEFIKALEIIYRR